MAESDIPFDNFIIKDSQNTASVGEVPERLRTQISVLLEKRYRGESLGDRIGRWNYATNNYVEPAINTLSPYNIYTKNIVKPKVRANAATMSQASIAITCEPRMQSNTTSKKNAIISQKVADWVDSNLWTSDKVLRQNEIKQLTHGVFVENVWDSTKMGRMYEQDGWDEEEFELPAKFGCLKCGADAYQDPDVEKVSKSEGEFDGGDTDVSMAQKDTDEVIENPVCPECNGPTEIITESSKESLPKLSRVKQRFHGDNDLRVHPSLEFRVDERYSQGGNLDKCRWFEHHPLMSKFEIELEFDPKDLGDAEDWCYANKWLYTLQTGTQYPFKSYRQTQETLKKLELYEVRYRYYTPEWLACYTAGVDYKFEHPKYGFEIKKGQNARDVVLEMAEEDAEKRESKVLRTGLCVILTGKKILGYQLVDFRKKFRYNYFVSDPYSFWGMCYTELETMQHLVNQTLTAIGNQVQSNQNVLIVDRDAYDADDVEGSKNVIYTRENLDKPIAETWGFMPATSVTPDSWHMVDWAADSAEKDSMVSREMQGQPSATKTFGQAQLNRDQSVGVLTPAQQSTADAKVGSVLQHCLIAQEHWPKERLQELCDTESGIITDDDIETWYHSDLEADVIFSYRPGSEMPKSFVERRDDIEHITGFIAELAQVVPDVMNAQLAMELINRAVNYSAMDDLDLQNTNMDTEVAEIRYNLIVEETEQATQQQLSIQQPQEQMIMAIIQQVMANPILTPLKQENHVAATEFYRDKCLVEYKKEGGPNLVLVAELQEMINRHTQQYIAQGQTVVKTQMAIQQPVQEQQQMAQQQQVEAEQVQARQQQAQAEQQAQQQQQKLLIDTATTAEKHDIERERLATEQQRTTDDRDEAMAHKLLDIASQEQNAGSATN